MEPNTGKPSGRPFPHIEVKTTPTVLVWCRPQPAQKTFEGTNHFRPLSAASIPVRQRLRSLRWWEGHRLPHGRGNRLLARERDRGGAPRRHGHHRNTHVSLFGVGAVSRAALRTPPAHNRPRGPVAAGPVNSPLGDGGA